MSQNTSNNMSNLACVNNKTEVSMEKEEYVVFEDALVLTGFGKYNYRVLILSVYSLIAAIAEVFSGGIIVAASQCDLALGVFEKGIIGSVPVLGVIISAHFWGYLADTRGRLCMLHITILGTAAFAFLCSFANHWIFLTITKFISAIFGCGTYAVIYTLLGESTLQTHRARFLLYATTGIMVAQAVICGIAYPTLLLRFSYYVPYLNIFFRPWRLFNQIIAFLSLLNYILFKCYILESPKFYFSKGEHDKGLEVLKKIFAVNNGRNMDEFNVKRIVLNEDENKTKSSNFFQSVWNQTIPLFHRKYIKKTVLIFAVSVPCYCIGPPFSVWMPLVFNTYKTLGTSDMRFCDIFQVQDVQTNPENNTFTDMSPVCDDTIVPFTFIAISSYALIMTAISIIAVIIVKYFGKKFMYIGIHLLGSTLAFIINVVPIDWSIGAFLGMMCNVVCMGLCTSYAVELFPTYMRAMAVGLSMMFARAVSFIFFNIIGVQLLNNCSNFLIFLGAFLLVGAALGLFLPSDRKPAAKEPDSDL